MVKHESAVLSEVLDNEVEWRFIRASGPGGQKVNKTSSAAQLRFHIAGSSLSEAVQQRLIQLVGNRVNAQGELVITGRRYRSQWQNRQDALARLCHFIELASREPRPLRKKTRVAKAADERRLQDKRHRAQVKQTRQKPQW